MCVHSVVQYSVAMWTPNLNVSLRVSWPALLNSGFSFPVQSLSAARPLVSVYSEKNQAVKDVTISLPAIFKAPIRPDVVNETHQLMRRNKRQAYAVSEEAGTFVALCSLCAAF